MGNECKIEETARSIKKIAIKTYIWKEKVEK